MVAGLEAVDALQVADHESPEAPVIPQDAGQEIRVASGGNAIQGVVRGHHGQGAGVDGGLEGGQDVLLEVAHSDDGRIAVVAAFRDAIGDEMLEGGDHALRGSAPHHRGSHLRGQIDVFSIGFFHAGPARFAGQVDDRAVADGRPLRLQFRADGFPHQLHEFRVPGGCQADRGGEHRRADGHVSVRRLLGQDDGDSEPGTVHRIALQGVVGLRGERRVESVLQGLPGPGIGAENGPEHASVLVLDEIPVGVGNGHAVGRYLVVHGPAQRAQELSQFLFDGHPFQEVVGPFLRGPVRIFVQRGLRAAGGKDSGCREETEYGVVLHDERIGLSTKVMKKTRLSNNRDYSYLCLLKQTL